MVQLFCAIVGEAGTFPVDIDQNKSVGHLKDAIKEKNAATITCDAKDLQLFLAKKGDAWLPDEERAALELEEGKIHQDIQTAIDGEQMRATKTLQYWLFAKNNMPQPSTDQIHVLVVVPKQEKLKWQSSRLGFHSYDLKSKYFLLEKEDMDDSGLPPKRLMLYCRPTFHMQFEFLREKVLKEGHLGWVLGPPGTGKSTTAMAFALTVDRDEWVVTWIHVDKNLSWRCVRLIGDERKTRIIDITELEEVLQFDDDSKHHLVLVDGWTAAESFTKLTITCAEWFLQKDVVMQRRLAFICSVAARGKVREDMEIVTRAMECQVWSWTLDEYLDATSDDTFFNDVLPYLDDSASDRSAMVETKYYYAGGSCRYMFYYNTTDVVEKLSSAVDSLNDAATTAPNGPRSLSSVNRLFAMFKRPFGAGAVAPVISRYAATTIAVKSGPDAIKKFMSTLRDNSNPALNGWMLEIFFFSSIRNGGLEIVDAAGNQIDKWDQSPVVVSDRIPVLSPDYPVWIKPENWKQGGYDAIMVCKQNRLVRMVQVTSAHTHTFRIEYFYLWLEMLSKSDESFEIGTLEIIFVVEREKLNGFKISTVTGQGQLKPFGWDKGTEAGRVQRVGVRGLYNLST